MRQMVHSGAHKCTTKVVIPAGDEKTISEDEHACSKVFTLREMGLKLPIWVQCFWTSQPDMV